MTNLSVMSLGFVCVWHIYVSIKKPNTKNKTENTKHKNKIKIYFINIIPFLTDLIFYPLSNNIYYIHKSMVLKENLLHGVLMMVHQHHQIQLSHFGLNLDSYDPPNLTQTNIYTTQHFIFSYIIAIITHIHTYTYTHTHTRIHTQPNTH